MNENDIKHLIFGKYNIEKVLKEVDEPKWQALRISLKGQSTEDKIKKLEQWLKERKYSEQSKVQVTNYVHALKRGGQIKMNHENRLR